MNLHVHDDLSAYLDGELSHEQTQTVDTHLSTCAECREMLDALRATTTELRALPEPVPHEQDSWALRAALVKEKGKGARVARWSVAAGGVAASLAAVLALTLGGSQTKNSSASRPEAGAMGLASVTPTVLDRNFSAKAAQGLLIGQFAATDSAAAPAPKAHTATDGERAQVDFGPQIARCEQQIFAGSPDAHTAVAFYVATFDKAKTPAFFLIYQLPKHKELWVVRQSDCYVLLFSQA